jgi:hypothetical protein
MPTRRWGANPVQHGYDVPFTPLCPKTDISIENGAASEADISGLGIGDLQSKLEEPGGPENIDVMADEIKRYKKPSTKKAKSGEKILSGFRVVLADGRQGEVEFAATTGEVLVNLDNGRPQKRPWFEETPREWVEGIWPEQVWASEEEVRVTERNHQVRERKDVADYRHALLCIRSQAKGMSMSEIAENVGRPVDWVARAVNKDPKKPKNLEHWDHEGFCEVRYLKRHYHQAGLYERIASSVEWEQDRVWRVHKNENGDWNLRTVKQCEKAGCGRSLQRVPDATVKVGPGDPRKSSSTQPHSNWFCQKALDGCVKPDVDTPLGDRYYWWCPMHRWYVCQSCQKQMQDKPTSKQIRHWYRGECDALDDLVYKVVRDFSLPDPGANYGDTARYTIKMNWYPDGMSQVTDHRHDNWTILVSLGSPRVLNVDHARVMMDDGDVILFGTQKHGVPVAPPCQGGRLSLVFMFSPVQRVQEAAMCLAVGDAPPQAPGQQAVGNDEEEPCFSQEDVHSLCALGFREEEAEEALEVCGGDCEAAANLLLSQ